MEHLLGISKRDGADVFGSTREIMNFQLKYPMLSKATSDSETPASGYILEEIVKLTHISPYFREELVEFMITKMKHHKYTIKLKALKILMKMCQEGHPDISIIMRARNGNVRDTTKGGAIGPSADRNSILFDSKVLELLQYIFEPDNAKRQLEESENYGNSGTHQKAPMDGYGSAKITGKYEGFGMSPISKQEGILDQVYEKIENVTASYTVKKEQELQAIISPSNGQYHPLTREQLCLDEILASLDVAQPTPSTTTSSVLSDYKSGFTPGRAMGGWESDEESYHYEKESGNHSQNFVHENLRTSQTS